MADSEFTLSRRKVLQGIATIPAIATLAGGRHSAKGALSLFSQPGARGADYCKVASQVEQYPNQQVGLEYSTVADETGYPLGGDVVFSTSDAFGSVQHTVTPLLAYQTYYAVLSISGNRVGQPIRFRTLPDPSGPLAMTWAYVSCQTSLNSSVVYQDGSPVQVGWQGILDDDPDLLWGSGDYGYWGKNLSPTDPSTKHLKLYRQQTNAFPIMRKVLQTRCSDQESDDHEIGQDNPDSWQNPIRVANIAAMQRMFAMYPMVDTSDGTYGSYMLSDRIRVVMTDAESLSRSPHSVPDGPGKTFFGAQQDDWFKTLVHDTPVPLNIIVNGKGYLGTSSPRKTWYDKVWDYPTWRTDFGSFVQTNGIGCVWMGGDRHMNGYCSGPNNPFGGFPIWLGSGISQQSHDPYPGEDYDWLYPSHGNHIWASQYLLGSLLDLGTGSILMAGTSKQVENTNQSPEQWVLSTGNTATDTWTY